MIKKKDESDTKWVLIREKDFRSLIWSASVMITILLVALLLK